ncbi:MAG: hypothetical protein FJ276_05010 [Planctomycetes bacterium]|nr:hypothetical protein [Planctomycetota bacterium]
MNPRTSTRIIQRTGRVSAALGLFLVVSVQLAAGRLAAGADAEFLRCVRDAVDAGRFSDAERMLREKIPEPDVPAVGPYETELEIIRRIRLDYSLTQDGLLKKLREAIPDVATADIDRWRDQGQLQYRTIDGHVCYFKSEPRNLYRFCEEAQARRRRAPARAGWEFSLTDHLVRLITLAEQSDDPSVFPVKHRIKYQLAVNKDRPQVKQGAKVRCWLPFPQEYRQQTDVRLISTTPTGAVIADNGQPHRCVYFELTVEDPSRPPVFQAEFEFVTSAWCPHLDPSKVQPNDVNGDLYREFTAERPPHIVFTPEVREIIAQVAGGQQNPLLRARAIFQWVDANIRYCSEVEYSTIRNISAKALEARRGDCGVQALAFITLCRAAGIPARWQSGWETKPNGWNMHDWAEFYIEPWGWLPADPSYGLQQHDDPRVREFFCGRMDPYRLIVNLDYGRELTPAKESFRSEPNDFQRGEIEIDGRNLYFDEWQWTFQPNTMPLTGDFVALEETFDAAVPPLLVREDIPGAVILVGRRAGDRFDTWQKAYGHQQTHPVPKPMRADAIFDLASMSKPIATGTSLMILADQGRIDVDDPVGKYLPEFSAGTKSGVTIRHLMTHMSGEKPYAGESEQKKVRDASGFPCRDAIRAYIRGMDLGREPGEVVHYSCLNAILSAEVVRVVSGMEHSEFAARHVFGPLKMNDTGFCPNVHLDERLVPTTRTDYGRGDGGFLLGQVHDPLAAMQGGVSGNAGLFGSASDLSRFAQMMLRGGELEGVRILQPGTVERMTSVQNPGAKNVGGSADRRGLLWDIYQPDQDDSGVDALFAYGHTGYTGTAIRIYPDRQVYVIALTNRVHPEDSGKVSQFRQAVWRIVGEVIGSGIR